MVANYEDKRMVAHNVADVPFVSAVMVRRRAFFQENPSIVFLTVKLFIAPLIKLKVEPCIVMAALIGRADAKSFMENGKKHHEAVPFHCRSDSGGFINPHTLAQLPGIDPGHHNGGVPGGIGKAQSAKASSMVLMLFLLSHRHAAPLKSPATRPTFS